MFTCKKDATKDYKLIYHILDFWLLSYLCVKYSGALAFSGNDSAWTPLKMTMRPRLRDTDVPCFMQPEGFPRLLDSLFTVAARLQQSFMFALDIQTV
jgi:hypothetical protein